MDAMTNRVLRAHSSSLSTVASTKAPRTDRGRRTLRAILDAAATEFGERGFHDTGITQITRPTLDVTLGFREGRTHLGPLPVGPAPRFY